MSGDYLFLLILFMFRVHIYIDDCILTGDNCINFDVT